MDVHFDSEYLSHELEEVGLFPEIQKNIEFYDDPRFFNYVVKLKRNQDCWKKYIIGNKIIGQEGSGASFISADLAYAKSIFEAIERFCLIAFRPEELISGNSILGKKYVDLASFVKSNINPKKITWVNGMNAYNREECLLPAQLVYLGYRLDKEEFRLDFPRISTGAAAASTFSQALLNGIYETVERDSFMNLYLCKASPPQIDLKKMKNETVNFILEKCKRYNLSLIVFDATTDIGIPTYVSVLIDRTGVGPAVSLGAKATLHAEEGIIGAITESFMMRLGTRIRLQKGTIRHSISGWVGTDPLARRAAYWLDPKQIQKLKFLFSGSSQEFKTESFSGSTDKELEFVLNHLRSLHYQVYYKDISIDAFRKIGVKVYKVLIPGLQPLFLTEKSKNKYINKERLQNARDFFGIKTTDINKMPHPFL